MRALKLYVVSGLITIFLLVAGAYSQTANARTGPEAINHQDANPKPSNPRADPATGAILDGASSPPAATPIKPIPGGQVAPASSAVAGQNSPPANAVPGQNAVPEDALFELFFNNISALNQVAANDEKAGNHAWAAQWRTHDQRAAGLNDAEGQILQETALDCLRMLKDQDAKFRAAAEKFRAQLKPGAPVLIPSELAQMDEDRKKIVSDHIERLREALGVASFSKLDSYVRSSFHAEVITPKPTPAAEKSPKESR